MNTGAADFATEVDRLLWVRVHTGSGKAGRRWARQTTWSARNTSLLTQRLFAYESVDSFAAAGRYRSPARAPAVASHPDRRGRVAAAAQSSPSVSVHNGTICIAFRRQISSLHLLIADLGPQKILLYRFWSTGRVGAPRCHEIVERRRTSH